MRLLDWNIRKINATSSRSLRRALDAIDEVDPDALALQEVGDGVRDALVAALESRGHVAVTSDVPTRLKGHRVLVAARRSLVGNSPRVFVHPTFPRAIVGIEMKDGARTSALVSFHVPNGAKQGWRKADCLNALADLAASNTPSRTLLLAGDANEPASYRPDGSAIPYVRRREKLRFDGEGRVLSTTKPWRDKRGESRSTHQWYDTIERVFPSGPARIFKIGRAHV